jgi:hypothetical protein
MKKEIDSWISEDYPKLSALKHPYKSIFAMLVWVTLIGFVVGLECRSILDGLVFAFLVILVVHMAVTSTKF